MIPHQGRALDTVNFRTVKDSGSVEIGGPASHLKGVPLDSGMATPGGEIADPFLEFNSVTLHHDDEVVMMHDGAGHTQNGRWWMIFLQWDPMSSTAFLMVYHVFLQWRFGAEKAEELMSHDGDCIPSSQDHETQPRLRVLRIVWRLKMFQKELLVQIYSWSEVFISTSWKHFPLSRFSPFSPMYDLFSSLIKDS
jgi:hypothetical protein